MQRVIVMPVVCSLVHKLRSICRIVAGLALFSQTAAAAELDALTLLAVDARAVVRPVLGSVVPGAGIISIHRAIPDAPRSTLSVLPRGGVLALKQVAMLSVSRYGGSRTYLFLGTSGAELLDPSGDVMLSARSDVIAFPTRITGRTVAVSMVSGSIRLSGGTIVGTGLLQPDARITLVGGSALSQGTSVTANPVPLPPALLLLASSLAALGFAACRRTSAEEK